MVLLGDSSVKMTPIPRKVITVVFIVQFAEAFQSSVLFPFVPFMVASFEGFQPEDVGTYSGFLAAAFVFGQLISSFPWGMLSDKYGEKPIVLISMGLTFVSSLLFGFCGQFYQAYLARFCAGLFNGNIGVIKTYLGKNTDSTNQGRAFGLVSAAWVIGCIVAPAIGGFLSQPALLYPDVFSQDGFFDQFPFVLPSLATSFVLLISWIASFVLIEDEKNPRLTPRHCCARLTNVLLCCCPTVLQPKTRFFKKFGEVKQGSTSAMYHKTLTSDSESDIEIDLSSAADSLPQALEMTEVEKTTQSSTLATIDSETDLLKPPPTLSSLTRPDLRSMLFAGFMYSSVCFLFIALDETFPLFCRAEVEQGGLGFLTDQIGLALSIMGVIEIIYIIFLFPRIYGRFSDMVSERLLFVVCICLFVFCVC